MIFPRTQIKLFEAFSGIGAQHESLKQLLEQFPDAFDLEAVGVSEIDENAYLCYTSAHGNVPNYGDISKIDWNTVPDFNMFTMSSPCTDFSQAGRQLGGEEGSGTRSSLLWECRRAIIAKRPKYVIFENVPALVSKKFKDGFLKWVSEMESYGYANFWQILNAKDYGTAQNRQRLFMVSILKTEDDLAPKYIFPEPIPLTKCVEDYMDSPDGLTDDYFVAQDRITKEILIQMLKEQPNVYQEVLKLYGKKRLQANTNTSN